MRVIFLVVALLFAGIAAPARAQTAEQSEHALREIGAWAQRVSGAYAELIALYASAAELNAMVEGFISGGKGEQQSVAHINAWREQFETRAAALRARMQTEINTPQLGPHNADLQAMVEIAERRFFETLDQAPAFANGMADISLRSVRGDLDAAEGAIQRARTMVREMVEFENGSYAIARALVGEGHPTRHYANASIAMNNTLVIVLDAMLLNAEGFNATQSQALVAEAQTMQREIALGREALAGLSRDLAQNLNVSPQMRGSIGRLYSSFGETFDSLNEVREFVLEASRSRQGGADYFDNLLARYEAIGLAIQAQNAFRANQLAQPPPSL